MEENQTQKPEQPAQKAEGGDAEKNKVMAILAYIIFFIPMLAAKDSKFAMYHAKQGLMNFILSVVVSIVGSIVPLLGWFLIILPVGSVVVLVFAIMGIINASKGEMKPIPWIGGLAVKWFKF